MRGIALTDLTRSLSKVSVHRQAKPAVQIKNLKERLSTGVTTYCERDYYEDDIVETYYRLPLRCFADFSFDELCKLKYSSQIMMDSSVCTLFENDANEYRVVEKIRSSMWRWGAGRNVWNEVVDAHNGIRTFTLDLGPEFDVHLDYTTGNNPFGYSEHERLFLDGVFGFLIHYRGRHVMTIGFSIMARRVLLLQQVQLKEARGNRFLYQLPTPYLPYVITRMKAAFPRHTINVIDGQDLVNKTTQDYTRALQWADSNGSDDRAHSTALRAALEHLHKDRNRIEQFYQNISPFTFTGKSNYTNHLTHHEVA